MSIAIESGFYVRISELAGGPTPFPLLSGFSDGTAYRTIGLYNPSESSDAYLVLINDRDELWFICNRHVRSVGLISSSQSVRLALSDAVDRVRSDEQR